MQMTFVSRMNLHGKLFPVQDIPRIRAQPIILLCSLTIIYVEGIQGTVDLSLY